MDEYEEELIRDPLTPKKWLNYIEATVSQGYTPCVSGDEHSLLAIHDEFMKVRLIYERAVQSIPGSFKLWKHFLDFWTDVLFNALLKAFRDGKYAQEDFSAIKSLLLQEFADINFAFERCLCIFPKYPRLWLDYASILMRQRRVTATRSVFNRALGALPFGQHDRVWDAYLKFAVAVESAAPITTRHIWLRYWNYVSDKSEAQSVARLIGSLERCRFFDDAARILAEVAASEEPVSMLLPSESSEGKDDEESEVLPGRYWRRFCELVSERGASIVSTPVESILKEAIANAMKRSNFSTLSQRREKGGPIHVTGVLWNALATWFIRRGLFADARRVLDEALQSVPTARDFALIFDVYTRMEESLIEALLDKTAKRQKKPPKTPNVSSVDSSVEVAMSNYARLTDEQPLLLSLVRIRQQPDSVSVWLERIETIKEYQRTHREDSALEKDQKIVEAFEEALSVINPKKAKGSLADLWMAYIRYLLSVSAQTEAESVFNRAINSDFPTVDDLADVWIGWASILLQGQAEHDADQNAHQATEGLEAAIDCIVGALVPPAKDFVKDKGEVHRHLFKSIKLWNFYIDLEEARGLEATVRAAYDRMIDLGIATPQTFINYALFLESLAVPKEAFRIYERGIASFGYPVAFEVWNVYLPKFVAHYEHDKREVERVRDLFEQALKGCPSDLCHAIFLKYAHFEESQGSPRHALRILQRAAHGVSDKERPAIFGMLCTKTMDVLGLAATRQVYEDAVNTIKDVQESVLFSLRYATLEASLGEFERARAIYIHAGSSADPRVITSLWNAWQDFETKHGTEETFRDMLRIKRAMTSKFAALMPFVPALTSTNTSNNNHNNNNDTDEIVL